MGQLSDYAENKVLDHVLKNDSYSRPANLFLALLSVLATDVSTGATISELSGGNYARIGCDNWSVAATRATSNSAKISFATPNADWGVIVGWAILDSITVGAGNVIAYGELTPAKNIDSGQTVDIDIGQLDISFNKGGCSNYLANILLDHLFEDTPFSQPTNLYHAFTTVHIADTDTGTTITEPSDGYARTKNNDWDVAASGESSNTNLVESEISSDVWGDILDHGIIDSLTTGNLLFYGELSAAVEILADQYIFFEANTLTITLD